MEAMQFDPYCSLQIHAEKAIDEVAETLASSLEAVNNVNSITSNTFFAVINRNMLYDEDKFIKEHDFSSSRYTASIEPATKDVDFDMYVNRLCEAIIALRGEGFLVAAACEYEDLVKKKTGWNWSEDDKIHPAADGD